MTRPHDSMGQMFVVLLFLACALLASYLVFAQPASSSVLPDEATVTAPTDNADTAPTDDNAIVIGLDADTSKGAARGGEAVCRGIELAWLILGNKRLTTDSF